MIRENKRAIQRARRELNRETNRLQNEKRRAENEIRALAAKGEKVRWNKTKVFLVQLFFFRRRFESRRKTSFAKEIS